MEDKEEMRRKEDKGEDGETWKTKEWKEEE